MVSYLSLSMCWPDFVVSQSKGSLCDLHYCRRPNQLVVVEVRQLRALGDVVDCAIYSIRSTPASMFRFVTIHFHRRPPLAWHFYFDLMHSFPNRQRHLMGYRWALQLMVLLFSLMATVVRVQRAIDLVAAN